MCVEDSSERPGILEGRDSAGGLPTYSEEEIKQRVACGSLLVLAKGRVYDIAPFVSQHPGGKQFLLKHVGRDVFGAMQGSGGGHVHTEAAWRIMEGYVVARLPGSTGQDPPAGMSGKGGDGYNVDLSKPIVGQVGYLGERYDEWVHTPVARTEPLRFFESDFLEYFSRTPWWVVPLLWIPLVLVSLGCSVAYHGTSLPKGGAFMGAGVSAWSLMEYCIHRYVFHSSPTSYWGTTLHFLLHGCHHKHPMDSTRLVFPPILTMMVVATYYSLSVALFPRGAALAFFGGSLLGYVAYDCTHYYVHYGEVPRLEHFKNLKRTHMAHHYSNHDVSFGITSDILDRVFGSRPQEGPKRT